MKANIDYTLSPKYRGFLIQSHLITDKTLNIAVQ